MITINIKKTKKVILPKNFKKNLTLFIDKIISKPDKNIDINIYFISSNKIQKINYKYRSIDKPTDVLSFPIYKNATIIKKTSDPVIFLGDIFICPEIVQKYLADYKLSTDTSPLTFIALHGIKHLLGIHHK